MTSTPRSRRCAPACGVPIYTGPAVRPHPRQGDAAGRRTCELQVATAAPGSIFPTIDEPGLAVHRTPLSVARCVGAAARRAPRCSSSSNEFPRPSSGTDADATMPCMRWPRTGRAARSVAHVFCADGHIGRVAVLAPWRRRGVGSALLRRLVDEATRRGDVRTIVNAQVAAMPFYARHRFAARDEWHEEAGIAHCVMERTSGR